MKMGIKHIQMIIGAQSERMKAKIEQFSVEIWSQWSKQAAELQILQADADNRKKVGGDIFYKMDKDSIITIRDELLDDFYALADAQIDVIQKLHEGFKDDQTQTILELEGYKRERRQKEVEQSAE